MLDILWIMVCTVLVFLMQPGFMCLEAGLVRAKNSINVAVKNIADFCVAGLVFWAVGFGLMYGLSTTGWLGGSGFLFNGDPSQFNDGAEELWLFAFFLFQLAFCSTCATIVSGATAERLTFAGYLTLAALTAGLIYPVFGHWAWGGVLGGEAGWLSARGFVDFAGSTVVHSVGGWIALAAILVIGPRIGRFEAKTNRLHPNNLPYASLGLFFLVIGWFGFNGGSALSFDGKVTLIVTNTALAAMAGGLTILLLTMVNRSIVRVPPFVNGIVASLVAITAACHAVTPAAALLIGSVGAAMTPLSTALLAKLKIDDAVGAIPAHLVAGIWGTLAVALFGDLNALGTGLTRLEQLEIQIIGIAAAGAFAFGLGWPLIALINLALPLRVSRENELDGLNVAEHGASTAVRDLLAEMEKQAISQDLSQPVTVEPGTDAGQIAMMYNAVSAAVDEEKQEREKAFRRLAQALEEARGANRSKDEFLANMSHELRTPLNAVIGFSEIIAAETFGPLNNDRYKEYLDDILFSSRHLLNVINDILDISKLGAGIYEIEEEEVRVALAVEKISRLIEPRAVEKGIALSRSVEPADLEVLADSRCLNQILLNLLSNAVKFTEPGGKVTLEASLTPTGAVLLQVEDTGIGIPAGDINRILEPFTQVALDTSGHMPDGAGLGLAITKRLVGLHQGDLAISSRIGKGTVVKVTLPAERHLGSETAKAPFQEAG